MDHILNYVTVPYYNNQYYSYPHEQLIVNGHNYGKYTYAPQPYQFQGYSYYTPLPTMWNPYYQYYFYSNNNDFRYHNYGPWNGRSSLISELSEISSENKSKLSLKSQKKMLPPLKKSTNTLWWKINMHKDNSKSDDEINQVGSSTTKKIRSNNSNQIEIVSCNMNAERNFKKRRAPMIQPSLRNSSLRIIKNEEDSISNQPTSEDIFHLINTNNTLHNKNESIPKSKILANESDEEMDKLEKNENNTENVKSNIKLQVNDHCREILSKFVLNETSNVFKLMDIKDTTDLGINLCKTMQFIFNEIHSIDPESNFLSLKLTPRQKHNIAELIMNEMKKLNLSGEMWARVCKIVISTLNQNFKEYFCKKNLNNESSNNSWLWLIETANSIWVNDN